MNKSHHLAYTLTCKFCQMHFSYTVYSKTWCFVSCIVSQCFPNHQTNIQSVKDGVLCDLPRYLVCQMPYDVSTLQYVWTVVPITLIYLSLLLVSKTTYLQH